MPELNFITAEGQTIDRELLICYGDCSDDGSLDLEPLGSGVNDSSMEYDWQEESSKDILGKTRTKMRKPIVTQTFDAAPLEAGDRYQKKVWNLGIREQNAAALCAQKLVVGHDYVGSTGKTFAECYDACMVKPTSLGGEGGGNINMTYEVTFGGNRVLGTLSKDTSGKVTFTPDAAE